jgi:acetyltransferase-like isoleucine patch superfamily enzyme
MSESKNFFGPLWNWNEHVDRKPIVIEDNVWIGERSTILKGVTIGRGSVVGCNSVVTHDVPPYCVVAGNPARIVKRLNKMDNGE